MKKLYITLLVALCTLSVQAWIFPDANETKKISVKTSDMLFRSVIQTKTNSKRGYVLYDETSQLVVTYGTYMVTRSNDGIFVGNFKQSESGTIYMSDAVFSVGLYHAAFPIKSVKMTYYKLGTDNSYTYYNNSCYSGNQTSETINGKEYYTLTFDFDAPVTQFIVGQSTAGEWNTKCDLAKDFGYAVKGIIITNVEVEYVDQTSIPVRNMVKALKEANIRNKINNNISASELSAYMSRAQAQNGDVNLDGAVNSTDVVTVYNNIINGTQKPTKSGQPYVDLGLPSGLKWATCNLGATTPEGFGDYFSWAPSDSSFVGGKTTFSSFEYKSTIPSSTYSEDGTGFSDASFPPYSILRYRNKWQTWRLPTIAEYQELLDNCIAEDKTINGVAGKLFTSKINNKTIFFPYCGHFTSSGFLNEDGLYWTKSSTRAGHACSFWCFEGVSKIQEESYRHLGASIRCVTY